MKNIFKKVNVMLYPLISFLVVLHIAITYIAWVPVSTIYESSQFYICMYYLIMCGSLTLTVAKFFPFLLSDYGQKAFDEAKGINFTKHYVNNPKIIIALILLSWVIIACDMHIIYTYYVKAMFYRNLLSEIAVSVVLTIVISHLCGLVYNVYMHSKQILMLKKLLK